MLRAQVRERRAWQTGAAAGRNEKWTDLVAMFVGSILGGFPQQPAATTLLRGGKTYVRQRRGERLPILTRPIGKVRIRSPWRPQCP